MPSTLATWRRHGNIYLALIVLILFTISIKYLRSDQDAWNQVVHHQSGIAEATTFSTTTDSVSLIPPKIWQIFLPPRSYKRDRFTTGVEPSVLGDTASWLVKNPDYQYTLIGSKWGDSFVDEHYPNSRIAEIYHLLRNPGLKSDLLRYMVLYIEGGVYTDIDTIALQPIDKWVPTEMKDKVKLVVGVEFDQRDGGLWMDIPHVVQLCQWTIAAAPGHPVFASMIDRAQTSLERLSELYQTSLENIKPTSFEVMNSTGPAAWTDAVLEQLHIIDPTITDSKHLSFLTGPKLYGDILVLPIAGFGWGQVHSGSTNDGTFPEESLLKHEFKGSWREKATAD